MERKYHTEPSVIETPPTLIFPTIETLSAADTTRKHDKLLGKLAAVTQEMEVLQEKADEIRRRIATETYGKEYPTLSNEFLARMYEWGEQCKREVTDGLDQLGIEEGGEYSVSRETYHDLDMAGGYTEFQKLTVRRHGTTYYLSNDKTYREDVLDRYNEAPQFKRYVIDANSTTPYMGEVANADSGFDSTALKGSEWRNVHYDAMSLCSIFAANIVVEKVLASLGDPDDPAIEVKHNHNLHFYIRSFVLDGALLRVMALYRDEDNERLLDNVRILLTREERAELECSVNAASLEVSLQPKRGISPSYQDIMSVLELLATINDRIGS